MTATAALLVALGAALASGGAALLASWESDSPAAVPKLKPFATTVGFGLALVEVGLWAGLPGA